MESRIKQELNASWLVLQEEAEIREDYRYHMLTDNRVRGLLTCSVERKDAEVRLSYEISGKTSLLEILRTERVSTELLKNLLTEILELEEETAGYLLPLKNVLLDPSYIFMEENRFWFCFCPVHEEDPGKAFHRLIAALLDYVNYDDEQAAEMLYLLHSKTRGSYSVGCLIREFQEQGIGCQTREQESSTVIEKKVSEPEEIRQKSSLKERLTVRSMEIKLKRDAKKQEKLMRRQEGRRQVAGTGGSWRGGFLMEDPDTMILGEQPDRYRKTETDRRAAYNGRTEPGRRAEDGRSTGPAVRPEYGQYKKKDSALTLVSENDGPGIVITETPYLLGTAPSEYNSCLPPSPDGEIHARIDRIAGFYFLQEETAGKGTYYNGRKLEHEERVRLCPGDLVMFADREYRVSELKI